MQDRRTVKTKRAIRNAFLGLLREKSINKITVSEISEMADLGRGTFYLHYRDVYDLYEQIEDELFVGLGRIFDDAFPANQPADIEALTQATLAYISANKEAYQLFALSEHYGKVLHKLRTFFCDKVFQYDEADAIPVQEKASIIFAISGVIGIIEEWLADHIEIPQEQLALLLHEILIKF